jgi:hypothetical protein
MAFKKILISAMVLFSMGAQAIPPIPPSAIYNKIRTIAARNCVTDTDVVVSEFKDVGPIKFVLQLNKAGTAGILTMMENGSEVESINVTCK